MTIRRTSSYLLACATAGLTLVAACAHEPPRPSAPMQPAAAPATERLGDPQIWKVMDVIRRGELSEAQLAMQKADGPLIRGYGQHVANMHEDGIRHDADVIKQLAIEPETSVTSEREGMVVRDDVRLLDGLGGWRFDRTYIAMQMRDLPKLIATIDSALLSQAQSATLRTELTTLRAHLVEHLNEARRIQVVLHGHGHASGL